MDIEKYVLTQLRCNERPIESPFASGALSGGLCYLSASLVCLYIPDLYLMLSIGSYTFIPTKALSLIVAGGAGFGTFVFWLTSVSVAKLRVTFDGSRTGFYLGFFVGANLGTVMLLLRLLPATKWQLAMVVTGYASEINGSAILGGSVCAFIGAMLGGIFARPTGLQRETPAPYFIDKNGGVRELILPLSDINGQTRSPQKERFQFSIRRIVFLTAVVAATTAIPRMIHTYMMSFPTLAQVSYLSLTLSVHMVATSLLILTYLVWVIFRGPQAFARLASAFARRKHGHQDLGAKPFNIDTAILSVLLLTAFNSLHAAGVSKPSVKPNIIVILADDLGYETIGANSGKSYRTPNLDRLASEGVRFEHCYAQPNCTPTRTQLMTGMSNVRNYVDFGSLDKSQTTFGHVFGRAGYATDIAGKWRVQDL